MNNIVIVLNEDGTLDKVLSNSEILLEVYRRGKEDGSIEAAEEILEEIELCQPK